MEDVIMVPLVMHAYAGWIDYVVKFPTTEMLL